MEEIKINVKGKEYKVKIEEINGKLRVFLGNEVYEVDSISDIEPLFADSIIGEKESENTKDVIKAPLPGTVSEIFVKINDQVKKGQSMIKLIAMKMENDITSPKDAKVKEIKVKKNEIVNRGDILIILD